MNQQRPDLFWVTLYTDASFREGVGGWSIWLRSSKGRIILSGACPPEVEDSLMAEYFAVQVGIEKAIEAWQPFGVQVNSDCKAVVDGLGSGYRWSKAKRIRQMQNRILRLGVKIRTKHVKAHTNGQDVRSYLNRQVDRYARQAVRQQEVL